MKRKSNNSKIAGFLAFIVLGCGLNSAAFVSAQQTVRPRITASPTPVTLPIPVRTPTPIGSPTPVITPAPTPAPPQTVADLQTKIRAALSRPEIRRGQVGVKVVSLDTGKVVFEENAEKYFMPASNMKSFTVAAALEKLSPDFRFVTSVYAPAMPDAAGVIRGDVTIYGRGDVSFSYSFNNDDYYKGLEALATKIAQTGVKRIEGNLIGDESYFTGSAIPGGWEWDDLQWYYGAEVSALAVNDNVVDLSVKPAVAVGAPCLIQILPFNSVIRIVNRCTTVAAGTKRDLRVFKKLDQNILEITGTMPADDKGFKNFVAATRPAEVFISVMRNLLAQKGVIVTGRNRVVGWQEKPDLSAVLMAPQVEIAKIESPPLSLIAAKTMKPSQNMYTETILRALGEQTRIASAQNAALPPDSPLLNPKSESAALGISVVGNFLRDIGVAPDSVIQHDGSGLSRHNLITPAAAVSLYTFMAKQSRYQQAWRDSLTIAGVDGTLRNRFKGTKAADNVRGKTGTIDQVSALSGYVTTAAGERFVFSTVVNGVNNSAARSSVIDEIVVALANFNGKTNL